ncbi:hypothetical protein [Pyxidicoccus xibeiensis]|uniref:hypothetical protein n=1 Tax=Pyxidicoccus xibeiensis TaxID=2906759 RepID=UPI0020A7EFFD|nr:hypothetical protein [Pyxidicoccus xibeiensis]MCP3141313.1 hypothetical protein [Pyxidicoccus xibeiensis]
MKRTLLTLAAAALLATACDSDPDPTETPDAGSVDAGSPDGGPGDAGPGDGGTGDGGTDAGCENPTYTEDVSACQPAATDYRPRDPAANNGPEDAWPACISDTNTYSPIDPNISTVARVAAFDQLAVKLWKDGKVPTNLEFVESLDLFTQPEGLASRVQRREDVHYPPAPNGGRCRDQGVPETAPDRCVGPAKLLPIINDAFTRGARGETPRVQAARIEAALLWFLYVSPLSEVTSCGGAPKDCDSAWAYYTGGTERAVPKGLAAYVKALGPETHERAYDAALAVRCWRNLDNETGTATNTAMQQRALNQYDTALLRGTALILRQRLTELTCGDTEGNGARLAFINTIGPFFDRAARAINPARADALKAEVEKTDAEAVDVDAAVAALDALFPCP